MRVRHDLAERRAFILIVHLRFCRPRRSHKKKKRKTERIPSPVADIAARLRNARLMESRDSPVNAITVITSHYHNCYCDYTRGWHAYTQIPLSKLAFLIMSVHTLCSIEFNEVFAGVAIKNRRRGQTLKFLSLSLFPSLSPPLFLFAGKIFEYIFHHIRVPRACTCNRASRNEREKERDSGRYNTDRPACINSTDYVHKCVLCGTRHAINAPRV